MIKTGKRVVFDSNLGTAYVEVITRHPVGNLSKLISNLSGVKNNEKGLKFAIRPLENGIFVAVIPDPADIKLLSGGMLKHRLFVLVPLNKKIQLTFSWTYVDDDDEETFLKKRTFNIWMPHLLFDFSIYDTSGELYPNKRMIQVRCVDFPKSDGELVSTLSQHDHIIPPLPNMKLSGGYCSGDTAEYNKGDDLVSCLENIIDGYLFMGRNSDYSPIASNMMSNALGSNCIDILNDDGYPDDETNDGEFLILLRWWENHTVLVKKNWKNLFASYRVESLLF